MRKLGLGTNLCIVKLVLRVLLRDFEGVIIGHLIVKKARLFPWLGCKIFFGSEPSKSLVC